MSDENRASLNIDLSGFEPALPMKPQPKPEQDVIRQVSEANNFLSRAPRRHRTGRNVQLNVKVRAETVAQFTAMADEYRVVFGELLQQALDALKREKARSQG
jgi:hypothetical protein